MSFFSGLFSNEKTPSPPEISASSELFASTSFQTQSPTASGPSTPLSSLSQPPLIAPTAADTFSSAFDPAKLHPLANLGDKLDFLQLEEDQLTQVAGAASVLPSRGWTDDLCVGTGTTYLSGLGAGGVWGLREGLTRNLGERSSTKLRLNSVLNGMTRRGTLLGNSLGVLAIFYNLTNSTLDHVRGKHDVFNSLGAAAASGAIYKSTAGLRPAALSAGFMTLAAGGWTAFKTYV